MIAVEGRTLRHAERIRLVRFALAKRRRRLAKSIAHCPEPWPVDVERWARMRGEIAAFEATLAQLEAGENPPPSPLTGSKTRELPDSFAVSGSLVTRREGS